MKLGHFHVGVQCENALDKCLEMGACENEPCSPDQRLQGVQHPSTSWDRVIVLLSVNESAKVCETAQSAQDSAPVGQ
jgi:hypothetical protein